MSNPFEDDWTIEDIEAAIERDHPEELLYVPVLTSMNPPDCNWVANICVKLSNHLDFNVRGNAVLGFGHLARTCGCLDQSTVQPIIESALEDDNKYVRGQAACAADDIEKYLDWGVFNNA